MAQDVIVREEDCDVETVNLVLERALLAEDTFDALEILSESLIERVNALDIVNPETGEIAVKQDTILDDETLIKINRILFGS